MDRNRIDIGTGLTKRQLAGSEYTEYTKDLPKSIERNREEDGRKLSISGISKDPPEVDRHEIGVYIVFFDLDTLVLELPQKNFVVNLMQFVPEGWTIKGVELTSPAYMPPEIHRPFTEIFDIDPDNQEIIIGNFVDTEGEGVLFTIIKILLWNLLCARFTAEVGQPASDEAGQGMAKTVAERRERLLKCLDAEGEDAAQKFKALIEEPFVV